LLVGFIENTLNEANAAVMYLSLQKLLENVIFKDPSHPDFFVDFFKQHFLYKRKLIKL